ncbi:MAG: heme o synthase [Planctomycetota bacterium]|nr:heme o synthase [Planctomycetota bacterium]
MRADAPLSPTDSVASERPPPLASSSAGEMALRRLGRLLADVAETSKPRVTIMVLVTTFVGFALATAPGTPLDLATLVHLLVGTALLAASSSVLNQVMERRFDGLMARTENRPLAAGRWDPRGAVWVSVIGAAGAAVYLALCVGVLPALLGVATLLLYLLLYTPLKRRTPWSLAVGAVAGAMPPLMGWTAASGDVGPGAWILFAVLFFWQVPHFHAIAWLYRGEYRRAGFRLLAVVETSGRAVAVETVGYACALLAVSCAPGIFGLAGSRFLWVALPLGVAFLMLASWFAARRDGLSARLLLYASLVYLPAFLITWVATEA